jgi:hypothetical protein
MYRSYLAEFGLSPAARSRVSPSELQLELPRLGDQADNRPDSMR